RAVTWTDADGTATIATLNGGGAAALLFSGALNNQVGKKGAIVTGPNVVLEDVTLNGTTGKTKINFVSKGGNGVADLGTVEGTAPLDVFGGKGLHLTRKMDIPGV